MLSYLFAILANLVLAILWGITVLVIAAVEERERKKILIICEIQSNEASEELLV